MFAVRGTREANCKTMTVPTSASVDSTDAEPWTLRETLSERYGEVRGLQLGEAGTRLALQVQADHAREWQQQTEEPPPR